MSVRRIAAGVAALSMAVPVVVAANGDEAVGTAAFESLDVSVVDGDIVVVGSASFGGETLVIGEDATGETAPGLGHDLVQGEVTQDPETGDLTFRLVTDLAAPASAPGAVWGWPIGGSSLEDPKLLAFSGDTGAPGGFGFYLGTGGGVNESFATTPVSGQVDGNALVWTVPASALGLDAGDRISPAANVFTTIGMSGVLTFLNATDMIDGMTVTEKFGVGGGAEVTVLDAAGEEVDEVDARVRRGEFSATVEDLPAGTYTVVVTTRYADAEVSQTFTVTI